MKAGTKRARRVLIDNLNDNKLYSAFLGNPTTTSLLSTTQTHFTFLTAIMLTTTPRLHIRSPSPTTIEYTVTTAPPRTLPTTLLLVTSHLLRLPLASAALLLLHSLYRHSSFAKPLPPPTSTALSIVSTAFFTHCLSTTHYSSAGRLATAITTLLPPFLLLPICLALLYICVLRPHTEERLLALRGLGIQTSSSASTYLGSAATRFIPTAQIADVLVNEAFRGFEVRYYLVVVVRDEEEVVVVFPKLLPGRAIVERVWRGQKACLVMGAGEKERMKGSM